MTFKQAMRKIAHKAAEVTDDVMENLENGFVKHEDDLTGFLAGALSKGLKGLKTQGITWNASVLTHRRSGEEKKYGADLLIHVKLDTPNIKYSKGVLIQAKRIGPDEKLGSRSHDHLKKQCTAMLDYSPASFVFAYDPNGMRCGSASKIVGMNDQALYAQCDWTAYRFYLELFRCPIGDPRITSPYIKDLGADHELRIQGEGQIELDPPARRMRTL